MDLELPDQLAAEQRELIVELTLGEITETADLARNLDENAVPGNLAAVTAWLLPRIPGRAPHAHGGGHPRLLPRALTQ